MANQIVLNSSNVLPNSYNSIYDYKFINGSYTIKEGSTLSVRSIILPYSWFNINKSLYNNNSFSYTWVDGSVYTVTLSDSFYLFSDINNALQLSLIANGLYLIDASGNNVYYMNLITDVNAYGAQILFYIVPTTLPAGYTQPSNIYAGFYSTPTAITPYITISSTNNFGAIIGFKSGNYPTTNSATNVSFISNITPNASPVNSVIVRCNLIDNNVTMPSDILDSFTFQNTAFGSNGYYSPTYQAQVKLKTGTYSSLRITFVDQNFNQIQMNDSNALITLLINNKQ